MAVAVGSYHTIGLKSDGKVVSTKFTGSFNYGQCNVSGWRDIVAITAGGETTVGLKADGTVVAAGDNDHGQCNVSEWKLFRTTADKERDYLFACNMQASGTIEGLNQALTFFNGLGNYKDSAERVKACSIPLLNNEKTALRTELSNLKGIFSGRRRKQIEARLAEIEKELKKL